MTSFLPKHLPILALPPQTVLYPQTILSLNVVSESGVAILQSLIKDSERAPGNKPLILACAPLRALAIDETGDAKAVDPKQLLRLSAAPTTKDLFDYGTAARVLRLERLPAGGFLAVVEGLSRLRIEEYTNAGQPFFEAKVTSFLATPLTADDQILVSSLQTIATKLLDTIASVAPLGTLLSRRLKSATAAANSVSAGPLVDILYGSLPPSIGVPIEDKLVALATIPTAERVARGITVLAQLQETLSLRKKIGARMDENLTRRQREYALLAQLSAIRQELEEMAKKDPESSLLGRIRKSSKNGLKAPTPGPEEEDEGDELAALEKAIKEKDWTVESGTVAKRELKRLRKSPQQGSEYGVIRTYIETLLAIPWATSSPLSLSPTFVAEARAKLDADHYGLEKVKKRLLEWLAVLRLKQEVWEDENEAVISIAAADEQLSTSTEVVLRDPNQPVPTPALLQKPRDKGPILLLCGPPGTGKTSIAKSLADSMGRKFERISLGGVRDESEIRGHRRTYVGALPGAIAMALRRAGVNNPVILLDEIDKVGSSANQGDVGAALLELLDPNQNDSFQDHYLGIPLDLSSVLFIATANSLDTISGPLYDRMEVIELSGYIHQEKLEIARRYLLSKQMAANAVPKHLLTIDDPVLLHLITSYTREAGVRSLERELGSICRAKAVEFSLARDSAVAGGEKRTSELDVMLKNGYKVAVEQEDVDRMLGGSRYDPEALERESMVGVAVGLAYQGSGNGGILHIESSSSPGSGSLHLTGSLGNVIKESAQVALAWVKSHASELGISPKGVNAFRDIDIHVHFPSGAVKKDGPSAGVALVVSLVSLMRNIKVNHGVAMTGEITLRGNVGAVGGIREKVLAAHRAGIRTLLLPYKNEKDVTVDLPQTIRDDMTIHYLHSIWEALEGAFGGQLELPRGTGVAFESRL